MASGRFGSGDPMTNWVVALVWGLIIGVPAIGALVRPWPPPLDQSAAPSVAMHAVSDVAITTIGWSVMTAVVSLLLAFPVARMLAASRAKVRAVAMPLLIMGAVMPPWALYYAWWSSLKPGTWVFDAAATGGHVGLLRQVLLGMALLGTTWSIACCLLIPASMRWSTLQDQAMRLDGASWWRRQGARFRVERSGWLVTAVVVVALTMSWTTAFDLAGIMTLAHEWRARMSVGGSVASLSWLIGPQIVLALAVATVVWQWIRQPVGASGDLATSHWGSALLSGCLWCGIVGVPAMLLLLLATAGIDFAIWQDVGVGLLRAIMRGLMVAGLVMVITLLASHRPPWWIAMAEISWLAAALLPTPMVAACVGHAWSGSIMWSTSGAWVLAMTVRAGAVGILIGRWRMSQRASVTETLRRLDGAPWWQPGPGGLAAAMAGGCVALMMSIGDIELAAALAPPMDRPPLAVTLLNAIHYQRADTVVAALALLPVCGLVAAMLLVSSGRAGRRMPRIACLLMTASVSVLMIGCEQESSSAARLLPTDTEIGMRGRTPGRFDTPRGLDVHAGELYVVDRSSRVQRLAADGSVICWWPMPKIDNGRPVGLTVLADGRVAVADTHEYRILIFDPCGTLLTAFGEYGTGPGAFVYPTDVAEHASGRWYVSEYGGNDRISVFEPDGTWVRSFGQPGALGAVGAPAQFIRPQSISWSRDHDVLWVADSGNHVVQGVDPETGCTKVVIGQAALRYPYGLEVLDDDTLLVTEYGSHRLTRWSPSGALLGTWGGWGQLPGQTRMPWAVAWDGDADRVYVLDTGNARVLGMPARALR